MEQKEKDEQIAEILKTIEDGFEKEKNDPDPKIREQAIRETEMLKRQAFSLLDSIIHVGTGMQEPPLPKGKRLPTHEEYEKISALQAERKRISTLINATSGKIKKDLLNTYRELGYQQDDLIGDDIYFVPQSNRFAKK